MTDPHQRDYVTVKEYADRVGVHIQTVYSAIRRGLFKRKVERIGRTIRIRVSRGSIKERRAS